LQPTSFAELGLSAKVLAAIEAAGYAEPTPIQAQAIPVAMTGRDVLGIAQTGTGKTASFVLPMIARLESGRARARMPRSLILAPTRELAAQCAQSFEKYGINHKLDVALLIGGVSMDDQVRKLDRGVDVLIATPGRLIDHFGRGRIMLMGVEILVIDEADRMLDMGFIPDIEKICKLLPPKRQTLFFSATMPPEITRLVDQFLSEPARIEVARPATTAKTITQRFCFCDSGEDWAKRETLRELLRTLDVRNAIIFCNRKKDVAILLKSLTKHGFNAGALHGDMDQSSRTATLDKFRAGEIALLAASDVAARGLDIPDVSHVINYDVPWQADDYVHRIGRTGRAGKEGFSATIVTSDDIKAIDSIAKLIGEDAQWIGAPPDEAALADGRSRKRRGRGAPAGRGRPEGRPARSSERGSADRGPDRSADRRPRRDGQPERREATRRIMQLDRPETSDQPDIPDDAIGLPRRPVRRRERDDRGPIAAEATSVPAAQGGDRSERPQRMDRPERSERPGRPDRSERPDRAARPARIERTDRPDRAVNPDRAPERSARPERDIGTERAPRPERGERTERPVEAREKPSSRRPQRSGGNEPTPPAFGDHMPAFLKRPIRINAD
jgi:superfamily II DNA/RNA helicase